jgi:hypothetical protein
VLNYWNYYCLTSLNAQLIYYMLDLDVSKGAGPDCVPGSLVKSLANELFKPVFDLINFSCKHGIFPEFWKLSHIVPIFKSGDPENIENYRGISIISCLPKMFEKIVYDLIYPRVSSIIAPEQHGFMKGRSITTNLASQVLNWMEDGYQVDVAYTDFSKAFDKMSHPVLFERFRRVGFGGSCLDWFVSYLTGRRQIVKFGSAFSRLIFVPSSAPQGSHLGPLFFIVSINDVDGVLHHDVFLLIYADDIKIYYPVRTNLDCEKLQSALNNFFDWCNTNLLTLNVKKCKTIWMVK